MSWFVCPSGLTNLRPSGSRSMKGMLKVSSAGFELALPAIKPEVSASKTALYHLTKSPCWCTMHNSYIIASSIFTIANILVKQTNKQTCIHV